MDINLNQIGQIAVTVTDVARATNFYGQTLGLKHLFSAGNMSFFDCGGVRLMLAVPEKPEFNHPSSILYFKVQEIEALAAELAARGVSFEAMPRMVAKMPAYELWMAFFRDSEQNVMALMCEKPAAAQRAAP